MIAAEEPIISRLDRLDNILRHLEENKGVPYNKSARSSYASTHSSEIMTSDGHDASTDTSPKSVDNNHCRSIDDVKTETQVKGTLLERLVHVENRVIQLCTQMESELDSEKKKVDDRHHDTKTYTKKKGGLKELVKSCVKRDKKNKTKRDQHIDVPIQAM